MKLMKGSLLAFLIAVTLGFSFGTAGNVRVIFFLDPECPITNTYMLEIKNIEQAYAGKDVRFEAIFPVKSVNEQQINAFLKKYKITFTGRQDPDLSESEHYHATVMPQAVVVNKAGLVVYSGAIDDWYYGLGKRRPKASEHYLRNAIDATLEGNPVLKAKTEAYGCLINI
jgi:hypothetical protein